MHATNPPPKPTLSVRELRQKLAEDDFQIAKDKIERAERSLDELKGVLSGVLDVKNGKLSAGTIDYAAFRIETLSLLFEVAARTFNAHASSPEEAYNHFLMDLGDEVGLTFARDLIKRLKEKALFLEAREIPKLLDLWASFENDTGAGDTKVRECDQRHVVIELRNNPLRRRETKPHAHCGFYRSYLTSLLNEMYTVRARILEAQIAHAAVHAQKVNDVLERFDGDDKCIFELKTRPEFLTKAFDHLTMAYDRYYELDANGDFAASMNEARAALVSAQMGALGLDQERPPRQLFKVFKEELSHREFKRMDEVYQRLSSALHLEGGFKSNQSSAWAMLLDTRRTLYALEMLNFEDGKRSALRARAAVYDRLATLEELALKTESLASEEKNQLRTLIGKVRKGEIITEEAQTTLAQSLLKIGKQAWEVARPVLSDVLTAAVKKRFDLD